MQMTNQEFNQDLGKAKRESKHAPVIVTDSGKPKHVLLNYADYQKLTYNKTKTKTKTLYDWFAEADESVADIVLEIPKRSNEQRPTIVDSI